MFITKLNFTSDLKLIEKEVTTLVSTIGWRGNQLGLKHRLNSVEIWEDAVGSLYSFNEKKFIASEKDFTEWNLDSNSYIMNEVLKLSSILNLQVGRVRLMKLNPRCGLSVHCDTEVRYHYVVKTNSKSYICNNINENNNDLKVVAQCYHIPNDSFWYKVDTKQVHWVYNGGDTERIHIVICES